MRVDRLDHQPSHLAERIDVIGLVVIHGDVVAREQSTTHTASDHEAVTPAGQVTDAELSAHLPRRLPEDRASNAAVLEPMGAAALDPQLACEEAVDVPI